MKILVVGAGGIGGYFGGRLAAAGNEVAFAVRGRQKAALETNGLRVLSPLGDLYIPEPVLYDEARVSEPYDVVLLCTKMWGLEETLESLRPALAADTAVVPLQNGVDAEGIVAHTLGANHAVGGVAQISAHIEAPGVIAHHGRMARIAFGELSGGERARLQGFLAACEVAGLDAKLSGDITKDIWAKFVILTPLAGATAFYRKGIGEILATSEGRALHRSLMHETAQVARAKGVALREDLEEKLLATTEAMPGDTKASMAIDLERGNRLELPWLNGAVSRLGGEVGVATPGHDKVVEALEPYQMGAPNP